MTEASVAILAKAPIPGYAKTRLIPLTGADGAALLQAELIRRAVATATEAGIGPVTLWCAPDETHPSFRAAARRHGVTLAAQPPGDLGQRMLAAFTAAAAGPVILIGTDCPVLAPADLVAALHALAGADLVIAPAEDGGYGLIGARRALPELFDGMPWGGDRVAALTRERARRAGLVLTELRTVWDIDTPADVLRLEAGRLLDLRRIRTAAAHPSAGQPSRS